MSRFLYAVACLLLVLAAVPARARAAETSAERPVYDSEPSREPLSSPADVARGMKLPEGFKASVFAAEPDVRQPIAITTDERGRLWVAENYTYAEAKLNFDTSLRDRIVCFEDRDQDGRFDQRHVFWDRGQKLTSVEVGFGGVWALCAPQLLFIPDADGDLVPDGEPEVVLDGWNGDLIRHNIVNGLKWGPDGWLYGRQGIQATSLVGRPGAPASQRTQLNCSIWRYHPTRKVFEVVMQGGTNSWGFDYDDHGEMFFINTVIGHLWHVVPGAYSRRMYGTHFNPHLYELLEQTADHFHWDTAEKWQETKKGVSDSTSQAGGGHAHSGLMIYQGDNWPDRYRGLLYAINLHGRRVNCDRLSRRGCGYVGTHEPDFMLTSDPWFRALDLIYGPDGGVYIADWSDVGECHESNGVHRSSGRIYKITYGETKRPGKLDLRQMSDEQLVSLQLHKNDWYVRQSRRLLQERAADQRDMHAAHAALQAIYRDQPDPGRRLRAMWCLAATGGMDDAWLLKQLGDANEHVRVWTVRLLVDKLPVSPQVAAAFARQAASDKSGLVRVYLASAMQRLALEDRWPIAEALAQHGEDRADAELPLMLWYGIEPAVTEDPARAVALADRTQIPLVRRHLARRITSELDEDPSAVDRLVRLLEVDRPQEYQVEILSGMTAALEGWRQAPAPPAWKSVGPKLAASSYPDVQRLARELGVVFGDGRAVDSLRKLLTDTDADPAARRNALRVLVDARSQEIGPLLLKLLDDRVLVNEAIRGLAFYDQPETIKRLLMLYPRLYPQAREQAINTLSSRVAYARALVGALANGKLPAADISAFQARQLFSLGDATIDAALKQHWGEIRRTPEEKLRQMREIKSQLSSATLKAGDRAAGRALFQQKCANCHTLFGAGGTIGPDLTGGNRANLDYLLENVLDPSAAVAANFRTSIILLTDGRVLTGVVLQSNPRTVTVQTATERVALARGDIDEITPQNLSLMPEGLLNGLSQQQIRDLVAYLSGGSQVPLPVARQ
jgi:putative membrane-bound dehydrogenase-like protein